jgi:hypothetical protein
MLLSIVAKGCIRSLPFYACAAKDRKYKPVLWLSFSVSRGGSIITTTLNNNSQHGTIVCRKDGLCHSARMSFIIRTILCEIKAYLLISLKKY